MSSSSHSSDSNPVANYPLNSRYGKGLFRRRIRLSGQANHVVAELEDSCHGFRSVVYHNGEVVTDIQPASLRTPFNTCKGAEKPLKAMIGLPITSSTQAITADINPRSQCTHLFDLSLLAVSHCQRGDITRQYDITIADELDEPVAAIVMRDNKVVLNWKVQQWSITSPATFAGNPLYKGFAAWANVQLKGEEQEAAFILQKSYFVAQSRRYDLASMGGEQAKKHTSMLGACYTYSTPVVDDAIRNPNAVRDFTDTPEQLLKFQ